MPSDHEAPPSRKEFQRQSNKFEKLACAMKSLHGRLVSMCEIQVSKEKECDSLKQRLDKVRKEITEIRKENCEIKAILENLTKPYEYDRPTAMVIGETEIRSEIFKAKEIDKNQVESAALVQRYTHFFRNLVRMAYTNDQIASQEKNKLVAGAVDFTYMSMDLWNRFSRRSMDKVAKYRTTDVQKELCVLLLRMRDEVRCKRHGMANTSSRSISPNLTDRQKAQ